MIKIRIITAFPKDTELNLRNLEDLLPYQTEGTELSLVHNSIGTIHAQSDIDHEFAKPGIIKRAIEAQQDGVDAIVIESMGDTALSACREAVKIPVIGLSDISMRVASMLGRRFGIITAGSWHGYYLEKLAILYNVSNNLVGFKSLNLQPFFIDTTIKEELENKLIEAALYLIQIKEVDTILCGGSYFLGCNKWLREKLLLRDYDIQVIDPLPLAIYFARTLVEAGLSHSKQIYAAPKHATKIIGYPDFPHTPSVIMK